MFLPEIPLTRTGGWATVFALLIAGAGGAFLLESRRIDDRLPRLSKTSSGSPARHQRIRLTEVPMAVAPSTSSLTFLHGEAAAVALRWTGDPRPVARVSLGEGPGVSRRLALVGGQGATYEWAGVLPVGATFYFSPGVVDRPARFDVTLVDRGGAAHPLFSEQVSPLRSEGEPVSSPVEGNLRGRWVSAFVPLSPWGGQQVRLRLATSVKDEGSAVFWGLPEILWTATEAFPRSRKGPLPPPPPKDLLLVVLETGPDLDALFGMRDGVLGVLPPWGWAKRLGFIPDPFGNGSGGPGLMDFVAGSLVFSRFYTSDVRPEKAFDDLLASESTASAAGGKGPSWVNVLRANGFRAQAAGSFSDDQMETLSKAGFDEVFRCPWNGHDSILATAQAVRWLGTEDRQRGLTVLYYKDLPEGRWLPIRYWSSALRFLTEIPFRWAPWKRAAQAAFFDVPMGFLAEQAEERDALWGVVSLRGLTEGGRGRIDRASSPRATLREKEIRVLFGVRRRSRPVPGVCRSVGQTFDVGPTFLNAALGSVPWSGPGKAWDMATASALEESSGRWLIRSPLARALVWDGRYKYVRHFQGEGDIFPSEEVFDLWTDPGEKKNLVRRRRPLLSRLREVSEETQPDPVDVVICFSNPEGLGVDLWAQSVDGPWQTVEASISARSRGPFEVYFSTNAPSGWVRMRPWSPLSPFRLRVRQGGKPVDPSRCYVSKWGIPLFEQKGEEWFDKSKFSWMEGMPVPAPDREGPAVWIGRVQREPVE